MGPSVYRIPLLKGKRMGHFFSNKEGDTHLIASDCKNSVTHFTMVVVTATTYSSGTTFIRTRLLTSASSLSSPYANSVTTLRGCFVSLGQIPSQPLLYNRMKLKRRRFPFTARSETVSE